MRIVIAVAAILLSMAFFGNLAAVVIPWIRDKGLEQFWREVGNWPRVLTLAGQLFAGLVLFGVGLFLFSRRPGRG